MPIYEYRCAACGHEFEKLQKMSDPDPDSCPECGKKGAVSRLISAAGFRLKGGGWYETDFKSGNRRNVAGDGSKKAGEKPTTDKKPAESAKTPASAKKGASGGEAA